MEDFSKIHSVKLVAAQDQVIIKRAFEEVAHVLADSVGGALIPLRAGRRLLRSKNVDETARKVVELVAGLNMSMQRHAVELSENVNRTQAGVQTVTNGNVDDAILSPERDGGLSAIFR